MFCPKCGKEVETPFCVNCGLRMPELAVDTPEPLMVEQVGVNPVQPQVEATAVTTEKKKKTIALPIVLIGSLLVLLVVAFLVWQSVAASQKKALYIENLTTINATMLTGAAKAEEACNLTKSVWSNTIYKKNDVKTNKFTIVSDKYDETTTKHYGKDDFYDDFNSSLSNLFSDPEHISLIASIKANQDEVSDLFRALQDAPSDFEKWYQTLDSTYNEYIALTNLAINPTGNLQTFSESFRDCDNGFIAGYDKLKVLIPSNVVQSSVEASQISSEILEGVKSYIEESVEYDFKFLYVQERDGKVDITATMPGGMDSSAFALFTKQVVDSSATALEKNNVELNVLISALEAKNGDGLAIYFRTNNLRTGILSITDSKEIYADQTVDDIIEKLS